MARIGYDQRIMEKEKMKEMSRIEDESHIAKVEAGAKGEYFRAEREAAANKVSQPAGHGTAGSQCTLSGHSWCSHQSTWS